MSRPSGQTSWQRIQTLWYAMTSAFDMSGMRALEMKLTPPLRRHSETPSAEDYSAAYADEASITVPLSAEQAEQIVGSIPGRSPRQQQRAAVLTALRVFAPSASLSRIQVEALIDVAELLGESDNQDRVDCSRWDRLDRRLKLGFQSLGVVLFGMFALTVFFAISVAILINILGGTALIAIIGGVGSHLLLVSILILKIERHAPGLIIRTRARRHRRQKASERSR